MPQPNVNAGREREAAEARAELLRLAEEQGVRPVRFDELLGDPEAGDPRKKTWAIFSHCGASGAARCVRESVNEHQFNTTR